MTRRLGTFLLVVAAAPCGASCTPDLGRDPVPEAMEFDPQSVPPRAPQPTSLVVNPVSRRIEFGLAGIRLPDDCAESETLSPAECELDKYLETLDGFPTVTPAEAPSTAELDPRTLTAGQNVVVTAKSTGQVVTDVDVGFDDERRVIAIRGVPSFELDETYWIGVRGYANGVRAANGREVVGTPTHALLKQDTPLTCGARRAEDLDPACPPYALLTQDRPPEEAARALFQLEAVRLQYKFGGGWELLAAAGLPREEVAVMWGFPIHSASVAELDPKSGLVPRATAADEIRVRVHGAVDPASVVSFVARERPGSVVLMDLTAAAAGDLQAGLPRTEARFEDGAIVIAGEAAFEPGHEYGLFVTRDVVDPSGVPLVPSPVSVLLTLRFPLLDDAEASTISSLSDADARELEAGRLSLAELFDGPVLGALTGVTRESLVYCFAFVFEAP